MPQRGDTLTAAELESSQRPAFLKQACNGDIDLQSEVEFLLDQEVEARSFIEAPARWKSLPECSPTDIAGSLAGAADRLNKVLTLLGAGGMERSTWPKIGSSDARSR